jgi:hypothetical protein
MERDFYNKGKGIRIYLGNLSHDAPAEIIRGAFEPFGEAPSARVIKDKNSGQSGWLEGKKGKIEFVLAAEFYRVYRLFPSFTYRVLMIIFFLKGGD